MITRGSAGLYSTAQWAGSIPHTPGSVSSSERRARLFATALLFADAVHDDRSDGVAYPSIPIRTARDVCRSGSAIADPLRPLCVSHIVRCRRRTCHGLAAIDGNETQQSPKQSCNVQPWPVQRTLRSWSAGLAPGKKIARV